MSEAVKPPERVTVNGTAGVKVYLCQPCAAKLRELAAKAPGGRLRSLDTRILCPECRAGSLAASAMRPPDGS